MKLQIFGDEEFGFSAHGEHEEIIDPALKPCPFCGGLEIKVENTHTPYYWAECETCWTEGPRTHIAEGSELVRPRSAVAAQHVEAFQAAIDAWNQRTTG